MHQRIRRFMRILLQQVGFRSANYGNTTFLQSTYQTVKAGKSFMNKFQRLHAYDGSTLAKHSVNMAHKCVSSLLPV